MRLALLFPLLYNEKVQLGDVQSLVQGHTAKWCLNLDMNIRALDLNHFTKLHFYKNLNGLTSLFWFSIPELKRLFSPPL